MLLVQHISVRLTCYVAVVKWQLRVSSLMVAFDPFLQLVAMPVGVSGLRVLEELWEGRVVQCVDGLVTFAANMPYLVRQVKPCARECELAVCTKTGRQPCAFACTHGSEFR